MSLQDRLAMEGHSLTPSERRTATVLLQDAQEVLFLSAAEVAARAKVHESTVIRLAQKLGYGGYAALKADLRLQAQSVDTSVRNRFRERDEYQLARLVEDEAKALLRMADTIDQERLDEVARSLIQARRIYVYGTPILVASLEKRLRRLGLDVVDLPSEGRDQAEKLMTLGKGDVLFAFVLHEPYPALAKLAQHADSQGAEVVVVSDVPGVNLPVTPKHYVIALRGADPSFRTLTVPIVFCYALELAVYHLTKASSSNALERLAALSAILGGSDKFDGTGQVK